VLHAVKTDQGAGSSKSCLAMDGDSAVVGDLVLCCGQELGYDLIRRSSTILELQIEMLDSLSCKLLLLILWTVKSDNK